MMGCVFGSYRAFLSIPGARRLLLSAVVTRMPNGMLTLALLLLIHAQTGSFAIAGVALGAFALANAAVSPIQGALVDRLGQPRVLGACAGGQSALLVLLVVAAQARLPSALLVVLVALAGALVPPSMACARALWSQIAPDAATRDAAYALDAITIEAAWILGPLLVVAVIALASPAAAVLLCAAITVGGTAVFATSPISRRWRSSGQRRSRAGAIASPQLRRLLASIALVGFWWGALQVGLPALALHVGSREASGALLALVSLGGVVGGVFYGARSWSVSIDARYWALLLLLAILLTPLIIARSLPAAIPLCLVAGLAFTPMISCQNTLVGAAAPAGTMTEAFTWATAAMFAGIAAGSTAAGSLIDTAGVGAPFAAACAAAALAAALAALAQRRPQPRTALEPAEYHAT
jgi:predicted MFS family arabinose efflux permease